MTSRGFTDIIGFTGTVKEVIIVKVDCRIEKNYLVERLLRIPAIDNCEVISTTEQGFRILIQFGDGLEKTAFVFVLREALPRDIKKTVVDLQNGNEEIYGILMAPYISDQSEKLCIESGFGYVDLSGNAYISFGTLFISEKGNPNKYPQKKKQKNLFDSASTTTSLILRKLLENTEKVWKLKYLSDEVGCSIGMVSRVKDELCAQLWAEMTKEGIRITDSRGLLEAWRKGYQIPKEKVVGCYTLESLPEFEKKLKGLRKNHGIESYLTGFSGGVRYAPVVRYNRIHVLVSPEDIDEFIQYSGCKRVDSGANILIYEAQDSEIAGAREIKSDWVASPVQVYLDCMQLKGRGEEMAEAVYEREIKR